MWEQERGWGDCDFMSSLRGEGWVQPVLRGDQEFMFSVVSLRCPLDTKCGAEEAAAVGQEQVWAGGTSLGVTGMQTVFKSLRLKRSQSNWA